MQEKAAGLDSRSSEPMNNGLRPQGAASPSVPGGTLGGGEVFALIASQVVRQGKRAAPGEILLLDPFRHNTRPLPNRHFPRQREPDLLMLPPKELLPPCGGSCPSTISSPLVA